MKPSRPNHSPTPRRLAAQSTARRAGLAGCRRALILAAVLGVLVGTVPATLAQTYGFYRELWDNLTTALGNNLAALTNTDYNPAWPDHPNPAYTTVLGSFETGVNTGMENYGQRLRGYLVPPMTGAYVFWISSDDSSNLFLSTDENPANKVLIARVDGWTNSREWTREANQQSSAINLVAGKRYYLEAIMQQGGGGDNLAVQWQLPTGALETPIPATRVQLDTAPSIQSQPTDVAVVEQTTATFTVGVNNFAPPNFQWQRGTTNIPDATGATLTLTNVPLSDNGAMFRCVLSNLIGTTNSAYAKLTVTPDTTPPTLVSIYNTGLNTLVATFSEGLRTPGATNPANYAITPGMAVSSAAFGSDAATVVLTTTPLTFGNTYTLTVNNLQDRAATPNTIAANSRLTFTALDYAPAEIGGAAQVGTNVAVPGGYNVSGGGNDIGGTADQCHFAWQVKNGNFDMQGRVVAVTATDPYVLAGIMVRETLSSNARFAGAFASSPQLGCVFKFRQGTGVAAQMAAPTGGVPVNYPYTWLRLRRVGSAVYGYASVDAQTWVPLGSQEFGSLPAQLYFGFAVTSDNTNALATAQIRDVGPTASTAEGTVTPVCEPPGPASRATGLVISEIMHHPSARTDGRNLEFIEIYNAETVFEDLTGWQIAGDISYQFPNGFHLAAGDYVVLAAAPDDLKVVYGITNVLGPYTGHLPGAGGTIQLFNNGGALRLEVDYSDAPPWPVAADGAGHSLVLARPSLGQNDPAAWAPSELAGGSPGRMEAVVATPLRNVVINELLAHTDPPEVDFIELYNHSNADVDLSGCWLSDDPATNRFQIPAGTTIPARGFRSFDANQLGFRLNAAGESVFFRDPQLTRVLDAVQFGAQENGVAYGRSPDGAPTFRRLRQPTPGAANAPWRLESVVINEIMYDPISGSDDDQYLELYNRSGTNVDLSGWELAQAVTFTFPTNTVLRADGYLVVARNAARLMTHYPQLNAANTLGDFKGRLSNNGEEIVLTRPHDLVGTNADGTLTTNLIQIVVGDVRYGIGGRWGQWADGGGSSLELIDPDADPLCAANWADSDETAKAPWTVVSVTNRLDNGNTAFGPNRLRLTMQGSGECLVDDVEVFRDGASTNNLVTNGGFELGATGWSFFGNHSTSGVDAIGAASGASCLHVRGQEGGDTGINGIRTPLKGGLINGGTGVIRAKVRWLKGWPEMLFRLQGNYLELPARMIVPANLGTPGLPNGRRVANAGPAIFGVTHSPPLPAAYQPVLVTCRVSDPDGIGLVRLQYRLDPSPALQTFQMRDDGTGGDAVAGDGVYTATIPGQGGGTLAAFRVLAWDGAGAAAGSAFPAATNQECLVRWGDPVPLGSFDHYHLWSTAATEAAFNRPPGLNNTWNDATLVCGNFRVIYNVGFRNKGSPFHQGYGDFAVQVPADDLLLGETERDFGCTGNDDEESTAVRSQLSGYLGEKLGIPYLHAHYLRLYRNGSQPWRVLEDLEVPNRDFARNWFPAGGSGELYKVSEWFEFQDDNVNFSSVNATIESFKTVGGAYKTARYRWNWERHSGDDTANNFTNLFDLVGAANDTSANYVSRMTNLVDMEEWMRVLAYNRILGNWDSWTYNTGQNMYAFKQPGGLWKLLPWDLDFTFGRGDGPTSPLGASSFGGGGQDPVANRLYDNATFKRMLWRAYEDAIAGPLLPQNFGPQIEARHAILAKNGIPNLDSLTQIYTYCSQRVAYIQRQLTVADAKQFAITSNGGEDFSSSTPTTVLQGTAPFAIATIAVNGVPFPVTWISPTTYRFTVPLTQATNALSLVGLDRRGQPVAGATNTITVTYTGAILQALGNVVLSEINYNPGQANASFIELFNRSTTMPFDLSGFRLDGAGYVFPSGSLIQPNSCLLLVNDRAAFAAAYGATIPVWDVFPGTLKNGGEYVALVQSGATTNDDVVISDVRYDSRPPWPTTADGFGASLQLIDPAQDTYRVGNWAATATNDVNRVTPGRANGMADTLDPFPLLWINEVQPLNAGAITDNTGRAQPWLELYNSGTNRLDLAPYYLTDNYTNLTRWQFPAGTTLDPAQFLILWADGQTNRSTASAIHTGFTLSATGGSLALARLQGLSHTPAVMDYVDYPPMPSGRSFGCVPDGEPRRRQLFQHATPGGANDPAWTPIAVTINEFMADNTKTLPDPAGGKYEDWFELYNAGASTVDLSGYTLTDTLTDPTQFVIPAGVTIPGQGFLVVWADDQTSSNHVGGALHANFKLSKSGEELGLFAPDGAMVDGFSFGPQSSDVTQGRYPDGADLPLLALDTPTPGAANFLAGGNRPPVFTPVADQTVAEGGRLQFTVSATDPDAGQSVSYFPDTNSPAGVAITASTGVVTWTPTEAQGPGDYVLTLHALDNGTPPRSSTLRVKVTVTEVNQPPMLAAVAGRSIPQGQLLTVQLAASDPDLPPNQLAFSLDAGGPDGAAVDPQSGVFTWLAPFDLAPGDYAFTVRVTDNGVPLLSATQTFHVTVLNAPKPPVFNPISAQTTDEQALWRLTVQAADPDTPPSTMVYSLDIAPAGALINAATGLISWTPAESQGPTNAVFVVRATKTADSNLTAAVTFSVKVNEVNQPPILSPIADQAVAETQTLKLTNTAWDPDIPANKLTFSLDAGAPAGMTIDPASGVLVWAPTAAQVSTTNLVTVRVTDDGAPPVSDTKSFQVVVRRGPAWQYVVASGTASSSTIYLYLTAPGEVYVDDITLVPGNEPGVGVNVVLDGDFETPLNGLWNISPNLAGSVLDTDHPHTGKSSLHVVASSGGSTRSSAIYQDMSPGLASGAPCTLGFWYLPGTTNTTLVVRLSGSGIVAGVNVVPYTNTAPALAAINSQTVNTGTTLTFTARAADADQPPQDLFFSLDPGAPAGATIGSVSGLFSWTPTFAQAPGTNQITVRVTDDGAPPRSDFKTFTVVVLKPALSITSIRLSPEGLPTFVWNSHAGGTYRVQFKNALGDPAWQTLKDIVAAGASTTFTDPTAQGAMERYYRVLLLP